MPCCLFLQKTLYRIKGAQKILKMHQELYDDSGSDIHLRWIKNDQDELEKLYEKYTELMVSNES